MPPKKCGKCDKTVYPTEELKCLDKSWHKGCFRCTTCNMMLTMKNYKGYDKLPYCNAHYPQTKHTAIADTPEQRRISQNTKIQSNIHYHREFEESMKGTYTQIADPLHVQQQLKSSKNVSLRAYHKDFEENKSKIRTVTDGVEMKTHAKNTKNFSLIKYHEDFEKQKGKKITVADDPEVMRVKQNMNIISNVTYHGDRDRRQEMESRRPDHQLEISQMRGGHMPPPAAPPAEPAGNTPYSSRNSAGARQVYDSNVGKGGAQPYQPPPPQQQQQQPQAPAHPPPQAYQPPPQPAYQPPPQQYQPPPPAQPKKDKWEGKGMVCVAMYDYQAADADEVSFAEGDFIINCQPIDAGWMEGSVDRTGQRGMLPSNYVERKPVHT